MQIRRQYVLVPRHQNIKFVDGVSAVFSSCRKDGIRFDVTAVFSTGAQIATRVMSVVPGEDNVFKQFAWSCIKTFADAMIELGEKPSLKSLSQNINKGIEDLLRALILQVVKQHADPDWREQAEVVPFTGISR